MTEVISPSTLFIWCVLIVLVVLLIQFIGERLIQWWLKRALRREREFADEQSWNAGKDARDLNPEQISVTARSDSAGDHGDRILPNGAGEGVPRSGDL